MSTKTLSQLALPMVISFTFRFVFTLVDTVYAAKVDESTGEPFAVAAIGLFIPVQTIFIALWVGLSAGFTGTLSQAFGAKDEARIAALKRAMRKVHVLLVPICGLVALAIALIVPTLGLKQGLTDAFLTYSLILVLTMPFAGFASIYPDSIVKAHHDTISTMMAGICSTITNVALNSLFVFVFEWGLAGIAIATALSRYAGLAYAMFRTTRLERKRRSENWPPPSQPTNWAPPLRSIFTLAIPGSVAYLLMLLEEGLTAKLLISMPNSEVAIASYGVYSRLLSLTVMPAVATAVAVLPYVARLLPEGKANQVFRDLPRALGQCMVLGLLLSLPAGLLFAEPLAEYFVKNDQVDGAAAATYLRLLPLATLCVIPYLMLRPVFEAANRPRIGVRIATVKTLVYALPLILGGRYLAPALGQDPLFGMLCGMILSTMLASITVIATGRAILRQRQPDDPRPTQMKESAAAD